MFAPRSPADRYPRRSAAPSLPESLCETFSGRRAPEPRPRPSPITHSAAVAMHRAGHLYYPLPPDNGTDVAASASASREAERRCGRQLWPAARAARRAGRAAEQGGAARRALLTDHAALLGAFEQITSTRPRTALTLLRAALAAHSSTATATRRRPTTASSSCGSSRRSSSSSPPAAPSPTRPSSGCAPVSTPRRRRRRPPRRRRRRRRRPRRRRRRPAPSATAATAATRPRGAAWRARCASPSTVDSRPSNTWTSAAPVRAAQFGAIRRNSCVTPRKSPRNSLQRPRPARPLSARGRSLIFELLDEKEMFARRVAGAVGPSRRRSARGSCGGRRGAHADGRRRRRRRRLALAVKVAQPRARRRLRRRAAAAAAAVRRRPSPSPPAPPRSPRRVRSTRDSRRRPPPPATPAPRLPPVRTA